MRELTPALGPYSHFKCYDSLVFASGQIPIDADGKVYSDAPIDVQTRLALENLSAVFKAAGASLEKALKGKKMPGLMHQHHRAKYQNCHNRGQQKIHKHLAYREL